MTTTMEHTGRQPLLSALRHLVTGTPEIKFDLSLILCELWSGTVVLMVIVEHVVTQEQETRSDRWLPMQSKTQTKELFAKVRSRTRMRQQFIKRLETVNSLYECEQECLNERTFKCLSFNYM